MKVVGAAIAAMAIGAILVSGCGPESSTPVKPAEQSEQTAVTTPTTEPATTGNAEDLGQFAVPAGNSASARR